MAEFFSYAVDKRLAPFWLPFGLRPGRDGVTITDAGTFLATFGFLKLETPLANIDEAHVTRNYRWWRLRPAEWWVSRLVLGVYWPPLSAATGSVSRSGSSKSMECSER
jgi:hypothetical protein